MNNSTFWHTFPAVRGMQSGRPCYIAMCPLRLIPKIFIFDEDEVPVELRAQRILNKARVPDIASYLVDNPRNYTLSSITSSVNGNVNFEPMSDTGPGQNMGNLSIPMDAQILINDGQHRRAAIEEALKENPELGHDHVSVLFFIDDGLERSQQMFADLNKHAVRPSDSISTLYDQRDQLSELARFLVKRVDIFKRLTELEKSSISNRSTKLFTISSIKNASKALLRKGPKMGVTDDEMEIAAQYWTEVSLHMPDWIAAQKRTVATSELREHTVHAHGVVLQALGLLGADLLASQPKNWPKTLKKLTTVDWARDNPVWEGRAMVHGRISKARNNVTLTTNYLKTSLGIPLNNLEEQAEKVFIK